MLTLKKIEIYKRYNRDIDSLQRFGRKKDKLLIEDDDWSLISGFISDLTLVKNGLAAESYVKGVYDQLLESCDSQETIEQIKQLVEQTENADKENEVHPESLFKKLLRVLKKNR